MTGVQTCALPILPDSKKTELQAYVDRFMSQHDWLQFNNLFKYDWFQTPYQRHILTGKGTKLLHTARSCTVSKLTPEQAVKMLQNYAGALPESARHRLISDPDHITDEMPFYAITDNGDGSILMGFALYIQPLTFVDPVTYEECSRNTVMIDLFRNPRACYSRIKSAYDVMSAVEIIFKQIQYSFGCKSPKTTIPGVIRGLMADTYLMKVFFDLAQTEYFHMPPRTPEHIEKYNLDPDIASLDFVLFQGDYKDLADITDGQMSLPFNKVLMKQDTIDQRLNASKAAMEEAEKKKKDESDLNAKLRKLRQSTDTKKKRRH